jgi:hypothetical protein
VVGQPSLTIDKKEKWNLNINQIGQHAGNNHPLRSDKIGDDLLSSFFSSSSSFLGKTTENKIKSWSRCISRRRGGKKKKTGEITVESNEKGALVSFLFGLICGEEGTKGVRHSSEKLCVCVCVCVVCFFF